MFQVQRSGLVDERAAFPSVAVPLAISHLGAPIEPACPKGHILPSTVIGCAVQEDFSNSARSPQQFIVADLRHRHIAATTYGWRRS